MGLLVHGTEPSVLPRVVTLMILLLLARNITLRCYWLSRIVSGWKLKPRFLGILLVLSSVGAFILIKNKTSNHWRWLLSAGCIMLTLATVDVILGYYVLFHFVLQGKGVPFRYVYPKYYLYVTNK